MEEKKEWTVMRAEPVVEVPNLWGVIKPEDVRHKYGGVDYMPWVLVKKYVKEHAPGWDFRLLPIKDNEQLSYLHRAPDGTAYVLAQWFHKPTGYMLPEFIHAVMDHRHQPVQLENVSARLLSDTQRRAGCSSAADAFGLAGELWARMPIEDPYRDLEDAKPKENPFKGKKPAKAKKPSKSKAELTTEYAAELGVTVDMVLAWSGLESIDAVIAHPEKSKEFKELLQKCKAGANAQELFSVEANTEFNWGEDLADEE